MKTDILYANQKVVAQDIASKLSDTVVCVQLFNRFYDVQKTAMTDLYVDFNKRLPHLPEQLQVWNEEDFASILKTIDTFIDETREDNLNCSQLQVDLKERGELERAKQTVVRMANKFAAGGPHIQMDDNWIAWIRGLAFSLQAWSNIFGQRLAKAVNLFDLVTELIFLSDKVLPFILDTIKRVGQENKIEAKAEDKSAEWKDLSMFLKGMDIRLNHLKAKLSTKWAEGAKAVDELIEKSYKLKKVVSFLWGEVSAKRIYNNLNKQMLDLTAAVSRMNLDKNYRFDKTQLSTLAEKVFTLVVAFHHPGRLRLAREPLPQIQNARCGHY